MKKRSQGFTLIELLVVLAILAILMGISIPGVGAIKRNLVKSQARTDAISIATVLSSYRNEYGRWPSWSGVDASGENRTDAAWVAVMSAEDAGPTPFSAYRVHNAKMVRFWTQDPASLDASGALVDPWGRAYYYKFDRNGDGSVTSPDEKDEDASIHASVIVWSLGPDGKTFIKSW
jgi:prepilin-type N-terminal cleavage/methylation domain-containing protein